MDRTPCSLLSCVPLHTPAQSVHVNTCSDIHVITYANDSSWPVTEVTGVRFQVSS